MRNPPLVIGEQAWSLLYGLHHGLRGPDYPDRDREHIRRLGELAQPAVLTGLLSLACDPHLTEAVAVAARALLRGLSALELAALDQELRVGPKLGGEILLKWDQLTPAQLPAMTAGSAGPWLAAALCSHRNGRVREAAVGILAAKMDSGLEVPFLFLRLNDWVEPVRQAAGIGLEPRLHEGNRDFLLDCLPLLERIPGRPDQRRLLEALRSFCCRPDLLEAALSSREPARRACAFRMALGHLPTEELLQRALRDSEQAIQIWATRQLRQAPVGQPFLLSLLEHANPAVRVAALTRTEVAPPERMLLDPSPRVRGAVRGRLAGMDFAAFYRGNLDCKAGVAGLGEVGGRADAALLAPLLADARLSRKAARAIGRLDAEGHQALLMEMLASPRPGLVREAFLALRPLAGRLLATCKQLIGEGPPHTRRLALTLLELGSKWESLPPLVKYRKDPELGEHAETLLRRWLQNYNKRLTRPTPAQLAELRQLSGIPSELETILRAL